MIKTATGFSERYFITIDTIASRSGDDYPDFISSLRKAFAFWARHEREHILLSASFGWSESGLLHCHCVVSSLGNLNDPSFLESQLANIGRVHTRLFDQSRFHQCSSYLYDKQPNKIGHHSHYVAPRLDNELFCPKVGKRCQKGKCRYK